MDRRYRLVRRLPVFQSQKCGPDENPVIMEHQTGLRYIVYAADNTGRSRVLNHKGKKMPRG